MSDANLTKRMTDARAAYERGVKYTMERLGDGAARLRKPPHEHDATHADLQKWLEGPNYGLRPPGARENLFRLSDYLSGRQPVPPVDVLTFLHAYIFALEGAHYHANERLRKLEKERPAAYLDAAPSSPGLT